MGLRHLIFTAIAVVTPGRALAQTVAPSAPVSQPVGEIVVTADRAGLLEKRPTSAVFGIDKPLLETPRAATFVSDTTLERYGITSIDNLVEISPSSYTAS